MTSISTCIRSSNTFGIKQQKPTYNKKDITKDCCSSSMYDNNDNKFDFCENLSPTFMSTYASTNSSNISLLYSSISILQGLSVAFDYVFVMDCSMYNTSNLITPNNQHNPSFLYRNHERLFPRCSSSDKIGINTTIKQQHQQKQPPPPQQAASNNADAANANVTAAGCFGDVLDTESANRINDLILEHCRLDTVVAKTAGQQGHPLPILPHRHHDEHHRVGVRFLQQQQQQEEEEWELTLFPILGRGDTNNNETISCDHHDTDNDGAVVVTIAMGGLVRVKRRQRRPVLVEEEKEDQYQEDDEVDHQHDNDDDDDDEEQVENKGKAINSTTRRTGTFISPSCPIMTSCDNQHHHEEEKETKGERKDGDRRGGESTTIPTPATTTGFAAVASAADTETTTSATACCPYYMQEAVRESEERHRTLFENMKQGVVYHAADGRTTDANESALRILGLTKDQMLGKSPMDPQWRFINPDGSTVPVEEYPAVVALSSGKPVSNKVMGVYYNNNQKDVHWVVLDAIPRYRPGDGDNDDHRKHNQQRKPYQAYTIFTDITKTKEEELNLLRAKQKAEEADQLKSAFLATMSHEIRTPLNGIMGHLDLILSNGLQNECKRENLEGLQVAMDSGKLLLSIIQDILDLSKIEAGLLEIDTNSSLDLRSVLSNTMKLAHAYQIQCKKGEHHQQQTATSATVCAAAGQIQVQLQLETVDARIANRIFGDEFRLQQILNNLLSNAIKDCCHDVADCNDEDDCYLEFCVHDTGKGIPEDRLEIIFEPFRQVEFGDTREHGGTGLGLTISKKLIEIMGGTLRVKSSMESGNSGSWFYFTLPYKPVPPMDDVAANKDPESPGIKIRRRRKLMSSSTKTVTITNTTNTDDQQSPPITTILLAEDDYASRQIATRMLEKAGCTVIQACDGAQAVSLFQQYRDTIDLILMDVMMPNMDGLEATEKIRDMELVSSGKSLESVPIVALSAGAMKGDRERGLHVGMNEYLYKPVTNAALRTTQDNARKICGLL